MICRRGSKNARSSILVHQWPSQKLKKKDGIQSIHSVHYTVQSFQNCPPQVVSMVSFTFPYQLGVACRFGLT